MPIEWRGNRRQEHQSDTLQTILIGFLDYYFYRQFAQESKRSGFVGDL